MLENDFTLRCWGYKGNESEYCSHHLQFPNLSVNAKHYGTDCKQGSEPCSLVDFLDRFYPDQNKVSYPRRPEEFLTYVKRMCGHDDLWELTVPAPELVAYVKNIVDMLLSSREAPAERAARANQTLTGMGSPFRVEVTDAGLTIRFDAEGERLEVARI